MISGPFLQAIMSKSAFVFLLVSLCMVVACSKDENPSAGGVSLISASVNGGSFSANLAGVPVSSMVELVFDKTLDPQKFEMELSIEGGSGSYELSFLNATTKVQIDLELDYETEYTISLGGGAIGAKGETLKGQFSHTFTTAADDVIRSMVPCTTAGSACLYDLEIQGSQSVGTVEYYSSYPIFEENAEWENLTSAIIVVHGLSNNANDYYSYLTTTLAGKNLADETILIAPHFEESSSGNNFYWSNDNWRTGQNSAGSNAISSFEIMDALITQLMDSERFPVLETIVVTGHSSGALFTHVYSGSNQIDNSTTIDLKYVVANSQYFYYPDGNRYNEDTKILYEPSNCVGYDFWPYGYNSTPSYLNNTNQAGFNTRFKSREVTYLIGNGTQADGSLNTSDCYATLLGSSRYKRGDNMFEYMELTYPGDHAHKRVVVEGIGHDGQGMYQSDEFKAWLDIL